MRLDALMRRGLGSCAVLLGLAAARGSVTPAPLAPPGLQASDARYSVTVIAAREVPYAVMRATEVTEGVLQVGAKGGAKPPRTIIFGGPGEYVREPLRELKIVAGRLLAATECFCEVFDLETGKKLASEYSSCNIKMSPDGKQVAYVERQYHFTDPHASGSVVRLLDVSSLVTYTVFPDASR